jgi:hypothetical protein
MQPVALRSKRTIRMFQPQGVRLSLTALTVYSYRAYQAEYQQQAPNHRQVAAATGLSHDTVRRADIALTEIGLLDCNRRPQPPQPGWFQSKRSTDPSRHWRHSLTSWELYVRARGYKISPLTVAVWSFLAHCASTNWQPRGGCGASYLATLLGANRTTIQDLLPRMTAANLIRRADGALCANNG